MMFLLIWLAISLATAPLTGRLMGFNERDISL